MSESSVRGKSFEVRVQKTTRRLLGLDIKRDRQSGAGLHKQDVRDRYNELPIFIECKNQKTLKPKEWWREADAKSSVGQAPVVVFPDNEEVLCVMRYGDLLNFIKEASDWRSTADDMRNSTLIVNTSSVADAVIKKVESGAKTCRNAHISDSYGYCNIKDCKFSRGYKAPKVKK